MMLGRFFLKRWHVRPSLSPRVMNEISNVSKFFEIGEKNIEIDGQDSEQK